VLETIYTVNEVRGLHQAQATHADVQHGAKISPAARILELWTGPRFLNTPREQVQRATEIGHFCTCWVGNTEVRSALRDRLRWFRWYATQLPGQPKIPSAMQHAQVASGPAP